MSRRSAVPDAPENQLRPGTPEWNEAPAKRPEFVYVTYIAATPERVWDALTNGEISRIYWAERKVQSDWQQGSPILFLMGNKGDQPDPVRGVVLEIAPPHKLVMSWAFEMPGEPLTPRSKVSYVIEREGPENVKLTVIHETMDPGSEVYEGLRNGWPAILSSLKTYLETGEALDATKRWARDAK
jgi:uncharacterized protein YndB with AHSA1/START domain